MEKKINVTIIKEPLEKLELSAGFIACSSKLGFQNLEQIICKGWIGLRAMEGFNFVWFNELVKFLEKHNILHLLEENE